MDDRGTSGPGGPPIDRDRWEEHLTRWQQAEEQFARDPAEGLRVAERLLIELHPVSGRSPTQVVRDFTFKREYTLGSEVPGTDPNPLSALADLGRGLKEAARMVERAQAASRGINAAREHRSASSDDFQQAMQVYRDAFAQLLGIQPDQLSAYTAGEMKPALTESSAGVSSDAFRERIIAEKLVREAMLPLEQAEARTDRRTTAKWAMIQLVGSLVIGLVMFGALMWVLSLE